MFSTGLADQYFENKINHAEIIYAVKHENVCEVFSRLSIAEIEVL